MCGAEQRAFVSPSSGSGEFESAMRSNCATIAARGMRYLSGARARPLARSPARTRIGKHRTPHTTHHSPNDFISKDVRRRGDLRRRGTSVVLMRVVDVFQESESEPGVATVAAGCRCCHFCGTSVAPSSGCRSTREESPSLSPPASPSPLRLASPPLLPFPFLRSPRRGSSLQSASRLGGGESSRGSVADRSRIADRDSDVDRHFRRRRHFRPRPPFGALFESHRKRAYLPIGLQ